MNGSNGTWNVKGRERNPRPFDIPHGLQIPCKLLGFSYAVSRQAMFHQ